MKFGGKSLATSDLVRAVAEYIKEHLSRQPNTKIVAVVSAMGDFTDKLEAQLKELAPRFYAEKEKNPEIAREADSGMQAGEVIAASLLSSGLLELGVRSKSMNAHQLRITTVGGFQNAKIQKIDGLKKLCEEFRSLDVVVATGFQGVHENEPDTIVTLGRGGSDTAAVALAAGLNSTCIFYKSSGIVTVFNPDVSPKAKPLSFVLYTDAKVLAEYGYQFLHPRAIEIARQFAVTLKFRASPRLGDDPWQPGTTISNQPGSIENVGNHFQAIAFKDNVNFITINGVPNALGWSQKIFLNFQEHSLLDFQQIAVGDGSASVINLVIDDKTATNCKSILKKIKKLHLDIQIHQIGELGCLTFIDSSMVNSAGFGYKIGKALAKAEVNIAGQITSGNKIHTFIKKDAEKKGTLALAKTFGLLTD